MNLGFGLSLTSYRQIATAPLEDPDAAIRELFGSGEVGAWYDPSDSTTVFQDAAGTTPATVGDPVGLILDKSQGLVLGSELVTNGTFDTDISGWADYPGTGNPSWDNGRLKIDGATQGDGAQQALTLTAGKTYKVSYDYELGTAASVRVYINLPDTGPTQTSSSGNGSFIFTATGNATLRATTGTGSTGTAWFDNISVKELPGNHATQTTSAARPVLQQSGDLYYLDFDGVDDYMAGPTFSPALAQPNTVGIALKQDALYSGSFDYGFFFDGLISTERHDLFANNGSVTVFAGTPQIIQAQDLNDHVFTLHYNTSNSEARVDGSSVLSSVDFGSQPWGGLYLGSLFPAAAPPAALQPNARIYSFVGVNRSLTAGEITDLETYLGSKTGFAAPVITGVPTISGLAQVGATLVASGASVASDPASTRSWQWFRDGSPIAGATEGIYFVEEADEGAQLSVRQIETNLMGVATATSIETSVVTAYSPDVLFSAGEVGAWYDPSDSTTVFQDAAGTTPATVGDPVGLILDKSQGGADATNQMPATSASDWTVFGSNTATNDADGSVLITYVDTPDAAVLILNNHYAGIRNASLSHVVSFEAKANSTPVSVVFNGSANGGSINVSTAAYQQFSFAVKWNGASANMSLQTNMNAGESINIKNVRVYELPGNHATQTTSAARPVLQQSGDVYYLDFDGVDDYMGPVTLPSKISQPWTDAYAITFNAYSGGNKYVIDGLSAGERTAVYGQSARLVFNSGADYFTPYTYPSSDVLVAIRQGVSSEVRRNGSSLGIGNMGTHQLAGWYISNAYVVNSTYTANMNWFGMVLVNRTLTSGEIEDLERYLGIKSGFTAPTITGLPTIS